MTVNWPLGISSAMTRCLWHALAMVMTRRFSVLAVRRVAQERADVVVKACGAAQPLMVFRPVVQSRKTVLQIRRSTRLHELYLLTHVQASSRGGCNGLRDHHDYPYGNSFHRDKNISYYINSNGNSDLHKSSRADSDKYRYVYFLYRRRCRSASHADTPCLASFW